MILKLLKAMFTFEGIIGLSIGAAFVYLIFFRNWHERAERRRRNQYPQAKHPGRNWKQELDVTENFYHEN